MSKSALAERVQVPVPQASAAELLNKFAVYGRFYEKHIAQTPELLRDRLEIAPAHWALDEVIHREPDLLVVMMNPGASRPLDALWDGGSRNGFVSAQPDRTQYQIMRLMLLAQGKGVQWQHARILNLSDLRTPKSAVFIEKLQTYQSDDSHSLFSAARSQECAKVFATKSTPILHAWGLSAALTAWALRALQASEGHPQLGITQDKVLFRHPLPQRFDLQQQWLVDIGLQIDQFTG
ncbi:hypothetical protein [Rhodoferax aquaticus]|uniref:DUF1643 domain-containing protein n=1 Tax=Rhodoferax aquaticus TaxID=2527691 RepID=A0A515EUG9_9BURK|nr:hypothetical protein [Rhodoferax aquaticus]QDL56249.1 hypothetical protein EXZ61_19975 [Rhodoferax aquaticus]